MKQNAVIQTACIANVLTLHFLNVFSIIQLGIIPGKSIILDSGWIFRNYSAWPSLNYSIQRRGSKPILVLLYC